MDARNKKLKKGIISSVLFHGRTLELESGELDPYAINPTVIHDWSSILKEVLTKYFQSRRIDAVALSSQHSSFLWDVACLMAGIERGIFVGNSKPAIVDIGSRLMAFEGWQSASRTSWADSVSYVDTEETRTKRSKDYRRLLLEHWGYKHPSEEKNFDDYLQWVDGLDVGPAIKALFFTK